MSALPQLPSSVHQNCAPQCEDAINTLINMKLYAAHVYLSMSNYFSKDELALKNFSHYFLKLSHGMQDLAEKLVELQKQRGAQVHFHKIQAPNNHNWKSGLNAMECALLLHKHVNEDLQDLHQLASDLHDYHLSSHLMEYFLPQQAQAVRELTDHVSTLREMGAPEAATAEYLFDSLILFDNLII